MKSFFKFESKEDKEVRRRMKKNGEVSFNSTMSPDCDHDTEDTESVDNVAKTMSLKLQSISKSSIDSNQMINPPVLPKPKKGILKTMSKFGIGPTLDKLQTGNSTSNITSASTAHQATQPQVLMNSSTNVPIVSSPKQQLKSPLKSPKMNSIENAIPNYTKRNGSQPVAGHVILNRSASMNDSDSFLLPPLRKLPEFLVNKEVQPGKVQTGNDCGVLDALIRCVHVPFGQLNQIDFVEAESGLVLVSCDQIKSKLGFLPGDELLSINEQLTGGKTVNELKQMLNTLQNNVMSTTSPVGSENEQRLPVHVRTSLECSELIVKNTCNGMFRIKRAETTSLNLMNSSLTNETHLLMRQLTSSSGTSVADQQGKSDDQQDQAWLIHTKGYSLVKIMSKLKPTGTGDASDSIKFRVRLETGNLIEVNEEDLEKINPSKYDFCEDLSQLQFINESSLMHTLRQRYQTLKLKHSYVGANSLFILSPKLVEPLSSTASYNSLKSPLYNDRIISIFKGCKSDEMPPHIYSYAQSVYRTMLSTRQDQSIILTGHSGSAKTTNAKYTLNYLFKVAAPSAATNNNTAFSEAKLNAMFCLLDAFCSISTDRNTHAANRFINMFLLEFNHSGQIASILLQLISLDHTRLVYQPANESNFLIFYYLLFGCSDATLKSDLQLDNNIQLNANTTDKEADRNLFFPGSFATTDLEKTSRIHFQQIMGAFDVLNVKESEVKAILSLLASIMLLGKAGAVSASTNSRFGQFKLPNEAHKVASLLGVSFQQLNDNIFCNLPTQSSGHHTKYGHSGSNAVSPDSASGANLTPVECLEGFCLGLYQEAMGMLTNFINRAFRTMSNMTNYQQYHQSISNSMLIIDPPGFQNQPQNGNSKPVPFSYSDLMCNYLSERLQLLFYQINFINPIEKCAQEGLNIDLVEHIPESPSQLVNWFDKPAAPAILNRTVNTIQPNGQLKSPISSNCGLLWLLEEQISSGHKSAEMFMRKLIESDQKKHFISVKTKQDGNFTIHHQFGQFPIEYNVSTWIENYCKEYITQLNVPIVLAESKKEFLSMALKTSAELSNQNNLAFQDSSSTSKSGNGFALKRQASIRKLVTMFKRKTFNVNFKLQLDSIFDSMRRTRCNFIFCSLPTTTQSVPLNKESSYQLLDVNLLRAQLKAYQILAACRIYRQGFPDCLNFEDFERRFSMFSLNANEVVQTHQPQNEDNHKKICLALLNNLELDTSQFKLGISQIFFKAGVLSKLEDQRDKKLNSLIVKLQSNCRRFLSQKAAEKKRVQDTAIRCIQKNVRISFMLKKWQWWKLYTHLLPIISVQNTETLFKQCQEELEEVKRKNERLATEKNNFQVLNQQLENKLMTLQSEYLEEHTTNAGTVELLEVENSERLRLEKELSDLKPAYGVALKKLESMESEMLELRLASTKQQISDELQGAGLNAEGFGTDGFDMMTVIQIDKLKRENESLKKKLAQEKEDEQEYRLKEKSYYENKIRDKEEDILEAEKQAAAHKRKYQKLCEEMQDIQRLNDEVKVRNNELEKIQRKFDVEMSHLRKDFETERELREKAERERDGLKFEVQLATGQAESANMEKEFVQERCDRMEKDLKEYEASKAGGGNGGSTGNSDFIRLKNQIRDMEAKIADQEEELDEQQGSIQQLEQTKLKLQMQGEKERSKWMRELAEKDSEMDDLRFHTQKKIKSIEMQLEEESEISSSLQREKRELERKLKEFGNIGKKSNFMLTLNSNGDIDSSDFNGTSIGNYITKLKRQMQKYKMLAIDGQTQLERFSETIPKQSILKALKSQLEDSEISKASALKAKQILQCEVNELQTQIEEDTVLRQNLEEQNRDLNREVSNLKCQLEDEERDMDELLKKLQKQVQANSLDSNHFSDLNNQMDQISAENRTLKEKIREYEDKICVFETTWVERCEFTKVESRVRDLECKLDLESTQKARFQNQLDRVRQQHEKSLSQYEGIVAREKKIEETLKKSQRQNREATEEFGDVQKKIIDLEETRKRLEQQNEILEKELEAARSEIKLNATRLDAFQNAFNSINDEIESDEDMEDNYGFEDDAEEDDDDSNDYDQNIPLSIES